MLLHKISNYVMDIFIEYSSIDNHHNSKVVEKARSYDNGSLWCATEKIHGANFSATTDGIEVKWGKRSSYIGDEGLSQFYNSHIVKNKYQDCILSLFKGLNSSFGYNRIRIFGELCGGNYPGFVSKVKPVQQGIYYCPSIEFIVFDIVIYKDTEYRFLSVTETIRYCTEHGLQSVKIMHTGTLDDMLNLTPEFESTIPCQLGYPSLPNNFAEGYVIRPIDYYHTPIGRLILKVKSKFFSEKSSKVKSIPKTIEQCKYIDIVDEICTYINQNRYNCVVSKLSEDQKKNNNQLYGLVIKDALKEFKSMAPDEMIDRFDKYRSHIMQEVMSKVMSLCT